MAEEENANAKTGIEKWQLSGLECRDTDLRNKKAVFVTVSVMSTGDDLCSDVFGNCGVKASVSQNFLIQD